MHFPHQMICIELSYRACKVLLDLANKKDADINHYLNQFYEEMECLNYDYNLVDFRGWVSEDGYYIAKEIERLGEASYRNGICFFWLED